MAITSIMSSVLFKFNSLNHLNKRFLLNPLMTESSKRRFLFGVKSTANDQKNEQKSESESQPENSEQNEVKDQNISQKLNELNEENKKLIDLIKEVDDKYKRSLADAENTRIRMRRQVEDAKVFGIQNFCKDLLEVADVLQTAIETVPIDAIEKNNSEENQILKNLYSGLQMTEKQLQTVFRRHGLTQINPIGEKFDPNSHHALFEAVEPDKEPGSVAIVTKVGYKLKERTIRPAMVGVVKASK